MPVTLHPSFAVHPGEWLRAEFVELHDLSVTDAAAKLGVTCQALSTLLNARAGLSADMVLRFKGAFGVRAETLMRMQAAHNLARAREKGGA